MEFIYAAYEQGVQDVGIDIDSTLQKRIDDAQQAYHQLGEQLTSEDVFHSLLGNPYATPMDVVLQMAGSLEMEIHAVNSETSKTATLFREAKGILSVPDTATTFQEKVEAYMKTGFGADKATLNRLLRRQASPFEVDLMHEQMLLRLSDTSHQIERSIFNEGETLKTIQGAIGDRPFLGFFQNGRLFQSSADLDGLLRTHYGDENVARLSMLSLEDKDYPKAPQYDYQYSMKACTVSMRQEPVRERHVGTTQPMQRSEPQIPRPKIYALLR
ncbi:MAG: hypothetical protein WC612_07940 [Bdellovibrionales bacterium]